MKFLIKTSAVGVSDTKSVNRGEYETEDEKEIERLKKLAKDYPQDVEVVTGKKKEAKKEEEKTEQAENASGDSKMNLKKLKDAQRRLTKLTGK